MSEVGERAAGRDERVRLFVAMDLPEAVRDALIRWREGALRRTTGVRALGADSLHVTLCFLGWRLEREIDEIAAACAALSSEPAQTVSLGEARWLPPRRPRVLAVELVDAGALGRMQEALSQVLAAGGWYQPEKRPFLAHVTVARVTRSGRAPQVSLPQLPSLEFRSTRVTLYRSRLSRAGARYEPLSTIELGVRSANG